MPEFKLSPLIRFSAVAGGLLYASAAASAAGSAYYRAELANPAAEARFVARDVVWACKGTTCLAGQGNSRPLIMCSSLARAAGPVASFTANGKALDADELARCNAGK